jgi:hypothetical protein
MVWTFRGQRVTDWQDSWRWLSVRFIAAGAALQVALLALGHDIRDYLPDWFTRIVAIAIFAGAFLGRITEQRKDHG